MPQNAVAIVAVIARTLLGAMLIVAAATKGANRESFARTLGALGMRGDHLVRFTAVLVPLLEACLGMLVIVGFWPQVVDLGLVLLMLTFTGVIALGMWRTPNTVCQCFGALSTTRFERRLLLRAVGLTLIALLVLVADNPATHSGAPIWAIALLIAGYLLLAVIAVRAVRFIEEIKGRLAA